MLHLPKLSLRRAVFGLEQLPRSQLKHRHVSAASTALGYRLVSTQSSQNVLRKNWERFPIRSHWRLASVRSMSARGNTSNLSANFDSKLIGVGLFGGALGILYWHFDPFSSSMGPAISVEEASVTSNPRVFLDMSIGGSPTGRIELELFKNICPKTCENFRCLCTGEKGIGRSGKPLHFKGSVFHRVIPGFMCQGGDFTNFNGTGGESIYGATFADEFEIGVIGHSQPLLLSMANAGRNTNGSQFFLTVAATPHLDGKHVVFGRVVAGQDVVKKIERMGSGSGRTQLIVRISDCGELVKNAVSETVDVHCVTASTSATN